MFPLLKHTNIDQHTKADFFLIKKPLIHCLGYSRNAYLYKKVTHGEIEGVFNRKIGSLIMPKFFWLTYPGLVWPGQIWQMHVTFFYIKTCSLQDLFLRIICICFFFFVFIKGE